jgi:hypothetical protein
MRPGVSHMIVPLSYTKWYDDFRIVALAHLKTSIMTTHFTPGKSPNLRTPLIKYCQTMLLG